MTVNRAGFLQTAYDLNIDKDTEARLIYTFDWSDWLDDGDGITTVDYEVSARANDPDPVTIEDFGFAGTQTFVELSGGVKDKIYIVTCKINTTKGLVDRRNFKVFVVQRSA